MRLLPKEYELWDDLEIGEPESWGFGGSFFGPRRYISSHGAALEVLSNLNMCHESSNQDNRRWLKQFFVCLFCIIDDSSQSRLHWSKRKRNTFSYLTSVAFLMTYQNRENSIIFLVLRD